MVPSRYTHKSARGRRDSVSRWTSASSSFSTRATRSRTVSTTISSSVCPRSRRQRRLECSTNAWRHDPSVLQARTIVVWSHRYRRQWAPAFGKRHNVGVMLCRVHPASLLRDTSRIALTGSRQRGEFRAVTMMGSNVTGPLEKPCVVWPMSM
jgi:hypothetical protein